MVLIIGFSLICIPLVIWNEYSWRIKMKNWSLTKGTIVDCAEEDDGDGYKFSYPVVQWSYQNSAKTFKSKYSIWRRKMGLEVKVLHSPCGASAEVYSASNRWILTLFALFLWFGAFFIGFFSHYD